MKKASIPLVFLMFLLTCSCMQKNNTSRQEELISNDSLNKQQAEQHEPPKITIIIEKDLLYDQHTLEDVYPYKDTTRMFQWDKIREGLRIIDSVQNTPATWAVLQNRRNKNGEPPLARDAKKNEYKNFADIYGVERYQGIPLYLLNDSIVPERYGRDGMLVKIVQMQDSSGFSKTEAAYFDGEWLVPKKYMKLIADTVIFKKVICVDRTNQNISTLEKVGSTWLVRSMNPATTGAHNPPYAHPTPLGIFVIQEKKEKMIYLVDGTQKTGGFAPYASRFSNGGYTHGVPVNAPRTSLIEFSATLGTIPRSHMCVRNATSHAQFIYDWAPIEASLVFVFE